MFEIYFKTVRDTAFKQIQEFKPGSWIYVKEAKLEDLNKIVEITGLDIADIRDSLDKYELPRIEHLGESIIIFVRHPIEQELGLYTDALTILLTDNFVIAISPHSSKIIEQLLASNIELGTTQKSKLILHILLKITQDFTNRIKKVRSTTLGAEQPDHMIDSHSIVALTKNEEILNQYLTSLVPMRNLLETMAGERYVNLYEKDLDLLEDLTIALRQSEDVCRVNIKSIRSLRDSYHIIFTNDVNRTIKLLTALTIIFGIPTMIASVYGMNVPIPVEKNPYSFWIILAMIIVASIGAVLIFRKKRWL